MISLPFLALLDPHLVISSVILIMFYHYKVS